MLEKSVRALFNRCITGEVVERRGSGAGRKAVGGVKGEEMASRTAESRASDLECEGYDALVLDQTKEHAEHCPVRMTVMEQLMHAGQFPICALLCRATPQSTLLCTHGRKAPKSV